MAQTTWNIDGSHSHVEFGVRHLMISTVRGRFGTVSGSVTVDDAAWTGATVNAVIDVASIETNEGARDNHLKSADFFDVANHPSITFVSRRIDGSSPARFKLIGDLRQDGDRSQRFRADLESSARNGRCRGGERSEDHARRRVGEASGVTPSNAE
jgi:polyisoprenoid-binding protein YceI